MTTANFFRWQREGFEMSFLRLRCEQDGEKQRARYDVTVLDEGHLVAALYDLSVPFHDTDDRQTFETQCVEAVINFVSSEDTGQVVTNWRHPVRKERLIELAQDFSAWEKTTEQKASSAA